MLGEETWIGKVEVERKHLFLKKQNRFSENLSMKTPITLLKYPGPEAEILTKLDLQVTIVRQAVITFYLLENQRRKLMSEESFEEGFYKFLRKNLTANDLRMTEEEFKKLKKKEKANE